MRGSPLPARAALRESTHLLATSMYTTEDDGWADRFRPVFPFLLVALLGCIIVAPAHALFKKKKKQPETLDQFSGRLVKLYWPIMANLGFSGAVGLACGLALRVRLHPEP